MTSYKIHIRLSLFFLLGCAIASYAQVRRVTADSTENSPKGYVPSTRPTFTPTDRYGDPFSSRQSTSPLLFGDPNGLTTEISLDTGMNYTIQQKLGAFDYRPQSTMSFEQYIDFQEKRRNREFMQAKAAGLDGESAVSGRQLIPTLYISPVFDRIFGGNYVNIEPTGFVTMDFGGRWQKIQNPTVPINQQRNGSFNYDQQISMNVVGKVGEKLQITANFDNQNTFDYQNNLKIEYTGYEEDIIKKIEIGNVSMPVTNSLMSGSETLFGIKTQMQFGKLYVTALASREQGTQNSQPFFDGFEDEPNGEKQGILATDYDEFKHFFLGHYFRDNYEYWLRDLPRVNSGVMITNVLVYKVSLGTNNQSNNRQNIIALTDLGESGDKIGNPVVVGNTASGPTSNDINNFYERINTELGSRDDVKSRLNALGMEENRDYIVVTNAVRLDPTQYTFKNNQGYISLRSKLNEGEQLAVAFEYTQGANRYKVGELPGTNPDANTSRPIILKLLKSSQPNYDRPIWDLSMKNVYTMPSAQGMDETSFLIDMYYDDPRQNNETINFNEGINTSGKTIVEVLKLDQLNSNGDALPDRKFDFIEGVTFDPEFGALVFPVLEPFGSTLEAAFEDSEQNLKDKYVFNELYETNKAGARLEAEKNRFKIVPQYDYTSNDQNVSITRQMDFNVAENSIQLKLGSRILEENVDYTVDGYNVTLLPHIAPNAKNIEIEFENRDVFAFSSKWLTGTRFDYQFNENFNVGATLMHLSERTQGISRYTIDNMPVKNTQYGFDINYTGESRTLTKAVDALPLISTKEKSTITFNGEFAQLLPGTSNKVNGAETAYIDDFESSFTSNSLAGGHLGWSLGSVPQHDDFGYTSGQLLENGYRRAKIAWYTIDRSFYVTGGQRPDNISSEDLANSFVKPIFPQDLFNIDPNVVNTNESIFDIAYFPHERGPYNYNNNVGEFNSQGLFVEPERNFGAISRAVNPVNWEATGNGENSQSVEFIEFWLMDPFIDEPINDGIFNSPNRDPDGGELVLNVGEISEDIIPDGLQGAEHMLPADGSTAQFDPASLFHTNSPPRTPNFFESSNTARTNQDIGLDGLNDQSELEKFQAHLGSLIDPEDPSNDNYKFYLDKSYDDTDAKIIERYKAFNNHQSNSPVNSNSNNFSNSATNNPDIEDLNGDNNLSELEQYFEYRIPIRPGQIANHPMVADVVKDQDNVNWYLFRIPKTDYTESYGRPSFSAIRFMRLYLTGWSSPVVLRMARFQTVTSDWTEYRGNIADPDFGVIPEGSDSELSISMIGVEQNGQATGDNTMPYDVPPGINRDLDNSTTITRRINEQSLKLLVTDLEDGQSRAAIKKIGTDLVNFKRLKMFIHAEQVGDQILADGQMYAFIRLGKDQTENYYEIQVPLEITPANLGLRGDELQRALWPKANEIDIALKDLYSIKSERNDNNVDIVEIYEKTLPSGHIVRVKGNPELSKVRQIMLGIRNPKDDGIARSACVWFNELRVSDIDNLKGWAANARLGVGLADFAKLTGSTQYVAPGFGGIQDRVTERSRDESFQYDLGAQINLDKLIPWETGVKAPMAMTYGQQKLTPYYDEFDTDTPLEIYLANLESKQAREEYKNEIIDQTTRRSINFMNVHKEKVKEDAKQHVYDIENFDFSYSYDETKASNAELDHRINKNYMGAINYSYSPKVPAIEPFKDGEAFSSPYLKLIKDINLNPLPNNFSVSGSANRHFERSLSKRREEGIFTTDGFEPNFQKNFTIDRSYVVRWNIFQNLGLNYSANTNAIVDEYDQGNNDTGEKRDFMWDNFWNMGRVKNYKQSVSATYRLPLDKIPAVDWMSADYRHAVDYMWYGGNTRRDTVITTKIITPYGNDISNGRVQDINAKFDFNKLYNKSETLRKINQPARRSRRPQSDTTREMSSGTKSMLKFMMMLKSINATWSQREGTSLAGFEPSPYMFGLDDAFDAPGTSFIFGSQDAGIRHLAARNEWLIRNEFQTTPFSQNLTKELTLRSNLEPFKDFRIQLDARKTNTAEYYEIFRYEPSSDAFETFSPTRTGSYTITFMPINTHFTKDGKFHRSPVFSDFEQNRAIIKNRLDNSKATPGSEFGINSQDVLIPAFIAAYTGKSPNSVALNPIPKTPLPNWRVDYAGLSKIKSLKEVFSSVNITHAYNSTFSISNYVNSSSYSSVENLNVLSLKKNIEDYPTATITEPGSDGTSYLTPVYTINQVRVTERFAPFLGVNVRSRGGVTFRLEYSRERNLLLDLATNRQITEQRSKGYTFDFGFTKSEWKFPFRIKGRTEIVKNEIQFRAAFTIRDTESFQRQLEGDQIITEGSGINYNIRPTLSYIVNQRLSLMMYFDKTINEPKLSNPPPSIRSNFGVQVRFSLAP